MDELDNEKERTAEAQSEKSVDNADEVIKPQIENAPENTEENDVKAVAPKKIKRQKHVSLLSAISLVALAMLATFMATFICMQTKYNREFKQFFTEKASTPVGQIESKLESVDYDVRKNFLYDIDEKELSDYVLRGYIYGLGDKHAEYYSKEEMEQMQQQMNSEYYGIGVSVIYDSEIGCLEIISVTKDSPAEKAGIMVGDLIAYVMYEKEYTPVSTLGYDMSVLSIKGDEGTDAKFMIYRNGDFSTPIEFTVERATIINNTVSYNISETDKTVGIVRISAFEAKTLDQFNDAVDSLLKMGAEKLVFDVRNNPGGELQVVSKMLDKLLPEGPVVRTVDRRGIETVEYSSDKNEIDVPMAVVTNGNTCSAAELFCAALQDYKKAKSVGENTYGKGSVQCTKQLSDGSGIKYTAYYYCPPYSDNFDGKGIPADVPVSLSDEAKNKNFYKLSEKEDTQLQAAIKEVNK